MFSGQDRGVKEDELQSILNYLLTMHEVRVCVCQREAGPFQTVIAAEWSL